MFRKINSRLLIISMVAIVATLFSQGSFAYYTTTDKATNVVTTGNIQFIIHETTDQGNPFPEEGVYIMPGDVVSKKVTVESDCGHPFYLRLKVIYGVNSQELTADECFRLNVNEEHWQYHEGWYYYKGIVEPGQTTPEIFSHVEIVGEKVDNSYIGKTLTLTVKAQAVQSEHNPMEGTDTFTAAGWPAE